ncbi:hypothetical protein [Azospirillum cavernae]|uniref:hypothetical protein n=1 Tax=Azospirillum cavernae TaxID=2320860 RepID=UPI0011C48B59|nr:hypothetical protein [Azospirillum cavernae]
MKFLAKGGGEAGSMDLVDVIRAEKRNVKVQEWKEGKVPKGQFPLSKSKAGVVVGRGWEWRIVTFEALNERFRVLIKLNLERQYYAAVLGLEKGQDTIVLCHHELHVSHRNWHCHYIRGNVTTALPGVLRDMDRMSGWPRSSDTPCSVEFKVTKGNAVSIAAARFQFQAQGGLL